MLQNININYNILIKKILIIKNNLVHKHMKYVK